MPAEKIHFRKNVEGGEEKPSFVVPESGEKEKPREPAEYQREAQAMVDSYRRFFQTFAQDVSLRFRLSDKFYIDLENGEVNLAAQWFAERGYSREQILWANLHELSHFRDLAEDPKRMMENFDYVQAQAKKTGAMILQKWVQKYGASDPTFIDRLKKQQPTSRKDPQKTMNAAERAAYQIHHTFYNIFDDVYVNNLVARKAPRYEPGTAGGNQVDALYRDKLFPKTDYAQLPRHMQFLYKLLREEMVPGEEVQISDEVKAALEEKVAFQGKEYMAREIVENFIKPRGRRDTKAGQRYFVLQKTLEPIFGELLKKDLDEWDPQKPHKQKGGKGKGDDSPEDANPFSGDYKDWNDNNPDQFDDNDIKEWADKAEIDKKNKEAEDMAKKADEGKTAEEKAKAGQEKIDQTWCEKHGVKSETLRQFRKIEAEVAPYLEELTKLWQRIIFGSTRKIEREMAGHFKMGSELDIEKTIEEWPQIQKGDIEKAEVMQKMVSKENLIERPELIRLRLVGDMSGSMNEAKRHVLQQCFVLLLSSLREFETHLNLTRSQTKTKLEVDTEGWIFGDEEKKIKKLRAESNFEDEQVEIVKIVEHLQNTIGNTYDNTALEKIIEEITPEERNKIAQERIMEMIFEITDGGSSDAAAARRAVDTLDDISVIARAFQIGETSEEEKATFNAVWNVNREEKLGEIVGKDIQNLLPAIAELLKKYLGNVRL